MGSTTPGISSVAPPVCAAAGRVLQGYMGVQGCPAVAATAAGHLAGA